MYQNDQAPAMGGNPQVDQTVVNMRKVAMALHEFGRTGKGPLPMFHMGCWDYCIAGWALAVCGEKVGPGHPSKRAICIEDRANQLLGRPGIFFSSSIDTSCEAANALDRLADERAAALSHVRLTG